MQICVVNINGRRAVFLEVESSNTISDIKKIIPDEVMMTPQLDEQILALITEEDPVVDFDIDKKLYFKYHELADSHTLADYGIMENDTLNLFVVLQKIIYADEFGPQNSISMSYKKLNGPANRITVFVVFPDGKRKTLVADREVNLISELLSGQIQYNELTTFVRQMTKPLISKMNPKAKKITVSVEKRLCLEGQILSDEDTLEKYNIQNNCELDLLVEVHWTEFLTSEDPKTEEKVVKLIYERNHSPPAVRNRSPICPVL